MLYSTEMNSIAILALRRALKLSQAEFAKRIGISLMTVSRWERGIRKPSPLALDALRRLEHNAAEKVEHHE